MEVQLSLQHAEQLLDFSQKLDINLLDTVVNCLYNSIGQQVSLGASRVVREGKDCSIIPIGTKGQVLSRLV